MDRTVWLVGMMGAGKSTVAPLVAAALDREWADTDALVAEASDASVPELVAADEARFRALEASAVGDVAGRPIVVACGGGAVTDAESVELMRATGVVVWLRATTPTLTARVASGTDRPLLGDDPEAALERIGAQREAAYRSAAHVIVDVDGRGADEVAGEVVRVCIASSEG